MTAKSYSEVIDRLRQAGLRPTRQRIGLGKLLFAGEHRHVTADQLHIEAERSGLSVSLATVYNTLHQFRNAGLLREVVAEPGRSYFDTNTEAHHHFFNVSEGALIDIPAADVDLPSLPVPPDGMGVDRVDIVIRVRNLT
ncbi:MAG: transcriptional repressor [Alphaproteobacteria bacterium]|nr:transcriptional repressor [Alphaproteobacteria bacterium]